MNNHPRKKKRNNKNTCKKLRDGGIGGDGRADGDGFGGIVLLQ